MFIDEYLFFLELATFVVAGSLIGEYSRSVKSGGTLQPRIFIAGCLVNAFIAFLVGYFFFATFENRKTALFLGGLLAYQTEDALKSVADDLISLVLSRFRGKGCS